MKKFVKYLLLVSFQLTTQVQDCFTQNWEIQMDHVDWWALDAVDSNVAAGYTVGGLYDQTIYRTTDGGESWQGYPWTEDMIMDLSIIDSLNFWAVDCFKIFHSLDGGKNWELQYDGVLTTSAFNYIEMFDSLNGIAQGDAIEGKPLLILKTTDGGKNWISQNKSYFVSAFSLDLWRCVHFISPEVGYGRFSYSGVPLDTVFVQKTIDSGKTWLPTPLCVRDIHVIRFFNEDIGIGIWKQNKGVYHTLDGGVTWTNHSLDLGIDSWCKDIEFFPDDPSKIFAVFRKQLFFSSDTGKTWIEVSTPDIKNFYDIKMVDSNFGWICGLEGLIHTKSGGVTSIKLIENKQIESFSLFQNYPNPFNSTTQLSFSLVKPGNISLRIYNLKGEEAAVLINNEFYDSGNYSKTFNAEGLGSGIYLAKLTTMPATTTIRMIFIK